MSASGCRPWACTRTATALRASCCLKSRATNLTRDIEELGCTAAEELLKPHRSYLNALDGLLDSGAIKGLAHITGGGLLENIPRILPAGTAVEIKQGAWPVLPVYKLHARIGNVAEREMYRTFNMGMGMVVVTSAEDADRVRAHLNERSEAHYLVGRVIEGSQSVSLVKA